MNTLTVYKAMAKKAAGSLPQSPAGNIGGYRRKPVGDILPEMITAPGSQPIMQPGVPAGGSEMPPDPNAAAAQATSSAESNPNIKAVADIGKKTIDAALQMTAMQNGITPDAIAKNTAVADAGQPLEQAPADPVAQLTGAPAIPKNASLHLGTVYQKMMEKKAFFESFIDKEA